MTLRGVILSELQSTTQQDGNVPCSQFSTCESVLGGPHQILSREPTSSFPTSKLSYLPVSHLAWLWTSCCQSPTSPETLGRGRPCLIITDRVQRTAMHICSNSRPSKLKGVNTELSLQSRKAQTAPPFFPGGGLCYREIAKIIGISVQLLLKMVLTMPSIL